MQTSIKFVEMYGSFFHKLKPSANISNVHGGLHIVETTYLFIL